MKKFAYEAKDGGTRCGTAANVEELEKNHWVKPGTAIEIPRLVRDFEGETFDLKSQTFALPALSLKEHADLDKKQELKNLVPSLKAGTAKWTPETQKVIAGLIERVLGE